MSKAMIIEHGIVIDEIPFTLVEKEGRPMAYFKKYGTKKEHFAPFDKEQAFYSRSGKSKGYIGFFDRSTLMQISQQEAFKDKKINDDKADKARQADDLLFAHKEAKKRLGGDTQSLAVLISWIAIIIVAILMFLSSYFFFTSPKTITIKCANCGTQSALITSPTNAQGSPVGIGTAGT